MRMSSLASDFRKVSAKLRTDLRLPRSNCMNTTWLLPLSYETYRAVVKLSEKELNEVLRNQKEVHSC